MFYMAGGRCAEFRPYTPKDATLIFILLLIVSICFGPIAHKSDSNMIIVSRKNR